ncbi:MAG: hypothetical protein KKF48_01570 [Nanoarchaeota archaeon]|nr:hypothetical protein [Nanoarchaeota archaeon]MBU1027710.1 hypothetical protein [Nanoarchaeota archaeon]
MKYPFKQFMGGVGDKVANAYLFLNNIPRPDEQLAKEGLDYIIRKVQVYRYKRREARK